MTLSGIRIAKANLKIVRVLIPLLLDDPLWVVISLFAALIAAGLNPSFAG